MEERESGNLDAAARREVRLIPDLAGNEMVQRRYIYISVQNSSMTVLESASASCSALVSFGTFASQPEKD